MNGLFDVMLPLPEFNIDPESVWAIPCFSQIRLALVVNS